MSLDVLKLYRGEDLIRQNLEDIDPNNIWLDERDLMGLLEVPRPEVEEAQPAAPEVRVTKAVVLEAPRIHTLICQCYQRIQRGRL